jgi:hypothetical protein
MSNWIWSGDERQLTDLKKLHPVFACVYPKGFGLTRFLVESYFAMNPQPQEKQITTAALAIVSAATSCLPSVCGILWVAWHKIARC